MIQKIADRLRRRDEGFTLIELMVVVLIIGILIAIAIPTVLGARKRAQDRAAQSSLRNAVTAAKAVFTDNEKFDGATATTLQKSEPSLRFTTDGTSTGAAQSTSDDPVEIVIITASGQTFNAVAYSKAGRCWFVKDIEGPEGVAGGTTWAVKDGLTSCTATTTPGTYVSTPGDAT